MAQLVKSPPAMQETRVWFLGQEDPLEQEMATHSRILAWRIPWTEESGRLQSMGLQESGTTERRTHQNFKFTYPLAQYKTAKELSQTNEEKQ